MNYRNYQRVIVAAAVITAFLYAVVSIFVLHTNKEVASIVAGCLLGVLILGIVLNRAVMGTQFGNKRIRLLPLISLLVSGIAIFGVSETKLMVSVQAAVVNQRLQNMASSISPEAASHTSNAQLQRRFKRIASIADTSISYGIRARPDLVNKVQDNLAETLKSTSKSGTGVQGSGATAFVALMAYAHYNKVAIALNTPTILLPHGETGNLMLYEVPLKNGNAWWQGSAEGTTIFAIPNPVGAVFPVSHSTVVFNQVNFRAFTRDRAFVDTDNESNVVVMNATVTGATQKIDSIVWTNVHFMGSRIIYHGGPLFLSGVTFENCLFDFGPDRTSQKLLSQIKEAGSDPVTVAYW